MIKFGWDIDKEKLNIENHGVSFEEATEVFYDTKAVQGFDAEYSENEERFYIIGFRVGVYCL